MTKRALLRILEREREAHQMERARLIETICLLAGNPTQVTDREMWRIEQEEDPVEPAIVHAHHYAE